VNRDVYVVSASIHQESDRAQDSNLPLHIEYLSSLVYAAMLAQKASFLVTRVAPGKSQRKNRLHASLTTAYPVGCRVS
jgi:hypothetical protein